MRHTAQEWRICAVRLIRAIRTRDETSTEERHVIAHLTDTINSLGRLIDHMAADDLEANIAGSTQDLGGIL